jgi:uncharacterized protein
MALIYLDTSVVLSLHIVDIHTAKVTATLRKPSVSLAVSPWVRAECASALGIMVRRKDLSAALALQANEDINALCSEAQSFAVSAAAYDLASSWMLNFELGLRAGDALHAAVAKLNKTPLFTCDKQLVKVGERLGFKVLTV